MSSRKNLNIKRHDLSTDKSLKAFSAADELLLTAFESLETEPKQLAIYNDRFGYLSCHLHSTHLKIVYSNKSQINAIELNLKANKLDDLTFLNPIESVSNEIDLALIKVPKSLPLFELYLQHVAENSNADSVVIISFMTRHFTPKIIEIAEKYFENVTQSKAVKKARTATLNGKKEQPKSANLDSLTFNNNTLQQYWGVFSAKHIDYATQYFLGHLQLKNEEQTVLDLASGNGIIAHQIAERLQHAEIHLMDDSILAVESAKLNLSGEKIHHYFNNNLEEFEDNFFDLIATNPPFHFEHEINIQIPIQLFRECYRCLKPGGNLQLVANNHLNYSTHLRSIFANVETLAQNENFSVLKCEK